MGGGTGRDHEGPIAQLKLHVSEMTELAVGMVKDGTRALLDEDHAAAASVVSRDTQLDRFDNDIETETMRLIAILQPEGGTLRTLGAVLKIANCVDRVGRLGYDMARFQVTPRIHPEPAHEALLRQMDEGTRAMVRQSIDAFVRNDAPMAKAVFVLDDDIDQLHRQVQREVIQLLQKGGASADRLAFELLAARHLERVGDNACKIAERAVYAITGERRTEYFPQFAHRSTSGPRPP